MAHAEATKARWPLRLATSLAVIFGPAVIIVVVGTPLADDEGEGIGLLSVAYYAMTAFVVGVVLVVGYFAVEWLLRSRRRPPTSN